MTAKSDIRKLFDTGFREPLRWTEWFFENVYDDSKVMLARSNSQPASCIFIDSYRLKLSKAMVNMAYLSCCTTAPQFRGRGFMSRLINDALMEASARGFAIAALIPASERLYFYYDRFGFSTVFYADEQRYTSLHNFTRDPQLTEQTPTYEAFHVLESMKRATVIHSSVDFKNIIADNALDNGIIIYVADRNTGAPAAMLFATSDDNSVIVRDMLSVSEKAADTALSFLRERIGDRMIIILARPSDNPVALKSRGMARIVNPLALLQAVAAEFPGTEQVIRLRDPLIPDNNAVYIIHDGHVERVTTTLRKITLDVTVDILARIIFNSRRVGETFSMPSFRPSMTLMLD